MTYIHQFNHYIIINTLLWSLLYYKFRPVLCLLLWCWRHSWRALAKFLPRPRPPPTAYHLPPPPLPNNTTFSGSGRQWVWANKKRNECTPMWYCVLYSGCQSSFLSSISVRLLSLSFDKHNNKKIRQTTTTTTSGCTILFADAPNLAPIIFSNSPCSSLFAFHFFSSSIFLPYMKENDCTYI